VHGLEEDSRHRLGRLPVVDWGLHGCATPLAPTLAPSGSLHGLLPPADESSDLGGGDRLASLVFDFHLPDRQAPSWVVDRALAVEAPAAANRIPGSHRTQKAPGHPHQAHRGRKWNVHRPKASSHRCNQGPWHHRLTKGAGAGMLRIGEERVVFTRDVDEGRQVCRGNGPPPCRPFSAERQVFEVNEFQDVLRYLSLRVYRPAISLTSFL
jgi:hypothetical protein